MSCNDCNNVYEYCSCDSGSNSSWTTVDGSSSYCSGSSSYSCGGSSKGKKCAPVCTTFLATVSPVSSLATTKPGYLRLFMRKKGGVVSISWEPFSGVITNNGVANIFINQTIPNLPPFAQDFPIRLQLRGVWQVGYVHIDPSNDVNMSFYLDISGNAVANNSDTFNIPASTINWVL